MLLHAMDAPPSPGGDGRASADDTRLGRAIEHALRATLSQASSMAYVLADQVDETQVPLVRSIHDAVGRAEDMLLDLTEFLRCDDDLYPESVRRRTNLASLCERVIDAIQRRYPTTAFQLRLDRGVDGCWDRDAVATMAARIVLNAVQHGIEGKTVRVQAGVCDDCALLEVWNAGTFPPDVAPQRVFEPFGSARRHRSGKGRGLGLGLYLASRTARAHGGRIELESDAERGTTLRVVLRRT
ncbi:MAG TPA: HAMP domain-containing sensor histidine kinase [Polyangiaceae bacterium]|jgi:signal transduction histidine kinase|nr:HAMP domain-containing sensor histidine kinase [Polyangiaceae bacterium]